MDVATVLASAHDDLEGHANSMSVVHAIKIF
jgi:hypothetical protein